MSPVETKLFSVDYVEELEEIYLASWRSSNVYSSQRILDRIMESDNNSEILSWKKGLKILLK